MSINRVMTVFFLVAILEGQALAYTGPSIGLGAIGVVLGVIASIFMGILAVIWYPVKRLIRKLRRKEIQQDQTASTNQESE